MNLPPPTSFAYPRLVAAIGFGLLLIVFSFLILLVTIPLGYNTTLFAWLIRYLGLVTVLFAGFWYLFHTLIDWPLNRI